MRLPIASLATAILLTACSREREPQPPATTAAAEVATIPDSATLARARAAADGLGRDLLGMLTAELQRGGPAGAIAICADSAQVRTERHAAEGIQVRRVGTRVRNAANTPDSTERQVLAAFAAAIAANRPMPDTAFLATGPDGVFRVHYLRAIRVQPQCLACHGDPASFAPAVRAVLTKRYPNDSATGYTEGALRGAISVRVPLTGSPSP